MSYKNVVKAKDGTHLLIAKEKKYKVYVAVVEVGSEVEDDIIHSREVADFTHTEEMDLEEARRIYECAELPEFD